MRLASHWVWFYILLGGLFVHLLRSRDCFTRLALINFICIIHSPYLYAPRAVDNPPNAEYHVYLCLRNLNSEILLNFCFNIIQLFKVFSISVLVYLPRKIMISLIFVSIIENMIHIVPLFISVNFYLSFKILQPDLMMKLMKLLNR